jgi:hypothetical protein
MGSGEKAVTNATEKTRLKQESSRLLLVSFLSSAVLTAIIYFL